jgi:hypothetical protein
MDPVTVAGHVMLTDLHNDLYMVGPYRTGTGTAVQLFLNNGYGISLGTSDYAGDTFPLVAPIRKNEDGTEDFTYAWTAHPDFTSVSHSERGGTVERAREILTYLREK